MAWKHSRIFKDFCEEAWSRNLILCPDDEIMVGDLFLYRSDSSGQILPEHEDAFVCDKQTQVPLRPDHFCIESKNILALLDSHDCCKVIRKTKQLCYCDAGFCLYSLQSRRILTMSDVFQCYYDNPQGNPYGTCSNEESNTECPVYQTYEQHKIDCEDFLPTEG
jgi:hypothetical protein